MSLRIKAVALMLSILGAGETIAASNPVSQSMVEQMITAASNIAGNGISIVNNAINVTPYLNIGDLYQGGVVFYLDETRRHGLVVSLNDQSSGAVWGSTSPSCYEGSSFVACNQAAILGLGQGIGSGIANTAIINSVDHTTQTTAAYFAASFVVQADGITNTSCPDLTADDPYQPTLPVSVCYGGWALPSPFELYLIYNNKQLINQAITDFGGTPIADANYWTSIDASAGNEAGRINFTNGEFKDESKTNTYRVRAIRAF